MKKSMFLTSVMCVMVASLCGCGGDSHYKVEQDRVALNKEYLAVLQSAKDEASAKAAVPKIEAIAAKLAELKKREAALGEPTESDFKQLMENAEKGGGDPAMEVMREHSRIAGNAALRSILAPAMNKVNE